MHILYTDVMIWGIENTTCMRTYLRVISFFIHYLLRKVWIVWLKYPQSCDGKQCPICMIKTNKTIPVIMLSSLCLLMLSLCVYNFSCFMFIIDSKHYIWLFNDHFIRPTNIYLCATVESWWDTTAVNCNLGIWRYLFAKTVSTTLLLNC